MTRGARIVRGSGFARRVDAPGDDAVHRDVVGRELGGERTGHTGQPGLGRGDVAAIGTARMGRAAADIDDGAVPELAHVWNAGLDAEEAAVERRTECLAPFLRRDFQERTIATDI